MARDVMLNRVRLRAIDGEQALTRDGLALGGTLPGTTIEVERAPGTGPDDPIAFYFRFEHGPSSSGPWTLLFDFHAGGATVTRSGPRPIQRWIRATVVPQPGTFDCLVTVAREE